MNRSFFVFFSVIASLLAFSPAGFADEVLDRIVALPGVDAIDKTTAEDTAQGLRRFELHIVQPTDHFDAASGTFRQKLILFHRGFNEPTVLQTSGYAIFGERLSRIANAFQTNQIQVEHRFFETSAPEPKDWTKLTVRQSAEDFHRVVTTFKALYGARWVGTGASKGGMTSVYHRRFHPEDLDGTVADVAPLSFSKDDARYVDFVDNVGNERYAACRANLEALQVTLLQRRAEILPTVTGEFTFLGSKDVGFEHATIEMPFVFWQYGNPEDVAFGCAKVPNQLASTDDLALFLSNISDPSGYNDDGLQGFVPYFYQSAAELGAPGSKLGHLAALLQHPYTLEQYLPAGVQVEYTDATMHDVHDWVAAQGQGVMFVYGEFDPWTAGAFRDLNSTEGSDNHWFLVPGGNHGANFTLLQGKQKTAAMTVLSRWLNKAPSNKALRAMRSRESLEDIERKVVRKLRIL